MKYKLLSTAIATVFLSACGSGGSESKEEPIKIEENAPPKISIQENLTLNENTISRLNFSVSDPENNPTQINIENNDSNFSASIEGNEIVITSNEVSENHEGSFFIVASDTKNTTRKQVNVNIIDSNNPPIINFPEQITLDEEPEKVFNLTIEDSDSENYSVSFDYNKSDFNLDYNSNESKLTIDYVGADITETIRKQFDIVVNDGVNEVLKNVTITVYPTNDNPIINFDNDIVISEGGLKYYKLNVDDDNIGEVTYQFNTEINGVNFNLINNNSQSDSNSEYSQYLVVDARGVDISTNINSYLELVVKDTFEGLDEIIETKTIDLNLLNQISIEPIVFNDKTDLGVSIPSLVNRDSFKFTIDLMKHSNPWTTHCFSDECSVSGNTNEFNFLDLDSEGWVKSLPEVNDPVNYTHVKTKVFDNSNEERKTKRFYVLFEGEGKITYDIQGQKNEKLSQPFMDVIDLDSYNSQLTINIEKQEDNYIKNIKVIPDAGFCDNLYSFSLEEDCNGNFVHFIDAYHYFDFHPDLIHSLKDYKVINLSNNLVVNNSSYVNQNGFFFNNENAKSWVSDKHGIPISKLVDLANYINADIALDIPVKSEQNEFLNKLITTLNNFDHLSYISYGNINENFSTSESDIQDLIGNYNSQLESFEDIVTNNRRQKLINDVNNNNSLTEEEKQDLISEINNKEMVSTEEKVLNIISKLNNEHCEYLTNNSSSNFLCQVRGSFTDNIINEFEYSYNEALLNCDIYREYLKTKPDTADNIEYWGNNNCSIFFDSVIIEPILGNYITSDNMNTIGSWNNDSDNSLFINFEQELYNDSTFEDSSFGAVSIFNNTLSNTIDTLNNFNIGFSSTNFRHNYYEEGITINTISESRNNMITMNTTTDSDLWSRAWVDIMESWIQLGGNSLILFNHVESNEDNGVRAIQSNEDQDTQHKKAVDTILNDYSCWSCQ